MDYFGTGTLIALLSAVGGGFLAKLVDSRSRLKTKQIDVAAELRDDMWAQNIEFERRIKACQEECDAWRKRYYQQYEAFIDIRTQLKKYAAKYGPLDASSDPRSGH